MKKVLAGLLASVILLSMAAACSSAPKPEDTAPPKNAPASETTEITFWHCLGGALLDPVEALVEEFNQTVGAEQGIHVTSVFQGDDVMAVLNPVLQTDDIANMPDIANVSYSETHVMSTCEYVLWLQDFLDGDSALDNEDFLKNAAYAVSVNGRMIALPFSVSAMILYYNKDMFRNAGLDPETPPATLSQLADYTQKLTIRQADGSIQVYGFACTPDRWHLSNWIGGLGSCIGNNEGGRTGAFTEISCANDGTLETVLTEYQKVVATGGVQNNAADQRAEFLAGQYAMILQSSSRISSFMAAAREGGWELGVAPLPAANEQAGGGESAGGAALYIFDRKDNARAQAAYTFAKWMGSADVQARWSQATGYVPTNVNSEATESWTAYTAETPEALVPLNILKNSSVDNQEPLDPISNELSSNYRDAFNALYEGKPVSEIISELTEKCNSALDYYYETNPEELW